MIFLLTFFFKKVFEYSSFSTIINFSNLNLEVKNKLSSQKHLKGFKFSNSCTQPSLLWTFPDRSAHLFRPYPPLRSLSRQFSLRAGQAGKASINSAGNCQTPVPPPCMAVTLSDSQHGKSSKVVGRDNKIAEKYFKGKLWKVWEQSYEQVVILNLA